MPKNSPLRRVLKFSHRVPLLSGGLKAVLRSGFARAVGAIGGSFVIRNLVVMSALTGLTSSITEFCWKGYMRQHFSQQQQYGSYMASAASTCGLVTIVVMVFGSFLFKWLGWTRAALITPMCYRFLGAAFLSCCVLFELGKRGVTPWLGAFVDANFSSILGR